MSLIDDPRLQKIPFQILVLVASLFAFIYIIYIRGDAQLSSGPTLLITLFIGSGIGAILGVVMKRTETSSPRRLQFLVFIIGFISVIVVGASSGFIFDNVIESNSIFLYQFLFGVFGGNLVVELFY